MIRKSILTLTIIICAAIVFAQRNGNLEKLAATEKSCRGADGLGYSITTCEMKNGDEMAVKGKHHPSLLNCSADAGESFWMYLRRFLRNEI